MKDVNINIHEELPIYKLSDLDEPNKDYRLAHDYKISYHQNIFGEKTYFLLKIDNYTHETAEHFFLVHDIANYLKRCFLDVRLYSATKPDIVFKHKNKKIAIEVETGKNLTHNKKQFLNKVRLLNENYKDWFFVVTNRNLVRKYKKYGKTFTRNNIVREIARYIHSDIYCSHTQNYY